MSYTSPHFLELICALNILSITNYSGIKCQQGTLVMQNDFLKLHVIY